MARTCLVVRASRQPKFKVRKRNRCFICGRPRAFIRKFGMCRICFRTLASEGKIAGVYKASW